MLTRAVAVLGFQLQRCAARWPLRSTPTDDAVEPGKLQGRAPRRSPPVTAPPPPAPATPALSASGARSSASAALAPAVTISVHRTGKRGKLAGTDCPTAPPQHRRQGRQPAQRTIAANVVDNRIIHGRRRPAVHHLRRADEQQVEAVGRPPAARRSAARAPWPERRHHRGRDRIGRDLERLPIASRRAEARRQPVDDAAKTKTPRPSTAQRRGAPTAPTPSERRAMPARRSPARPPPTGR